jgi:Flp pilus assembly protein TadG
MPMPSTTPAAPRRARGDRGAALVEAAVTLPLLLFVCVGIFEFGRAYQTWQVLTNAAREGARVAVLPGVNDAAVEDRVGDYMVSGQLPNAGSAEVDVDRANVISLGTGTASASAVTVRYPFEFVVLQPVASLIMAASATMRNEQ